jgi:hypothetical protein
MAGGRVSLWWGILGGFLYVFAGVLLVAGFTTLSIDLESSTYRLREWWFRSVMGEFSDFESLILQENWTVLSMNEAVKSWHVELVWKHPRKRRFRMESTDCYEGTSGADAEAELSRRYRALAARLGISLRKEVRSEWIQDGWTGEAVLSRTCRPSSPRSQERGLRVVGRETRSRADSGCGFQDVGQEALSSPPPECAAATPPSQRCAAETSSHGGAAGPDCPLAPSAHASRTRAASLRLPA